MNIFSLIFRFSFSSRVACIVIKVGQIFFGHVEWGCIWRKHFKTWDLKTMGLYLYCRNLTCLSYVLKIVSDYYSSQLKHLEKCPVFSMGKVYFSSLIENGINWTIKWNHCTFDLDNLTHTKFEIIKHFLKQLFFGITVSVTVSYQSALLHSFPPFPFSH